MDFGNPWSIFSGLIVGLIGMLLFMYGKRQQNLKCLGAGAVICVFPYFVSSILLTWGITAACLGGLYAWTRGD